MNEIHSCGYYCDKPACIKAQRDELRDKQLKDVERMNWLESSTEHHGFCHVAYGDYRYYAHQMEGCKTVRETIDAAMKVESGE